MNLRFNYSFLEHTFAFPEPADVWKTTLQYKFFAEIEVGGYMMKMHDIEILHAAPLDAFLFCDIQKILRNQLLLD